MGVMTIIGTENGSTASQAILGAVLLAWKKPVEHNGAVASH